MNGRLLQDDDKTYIVEIPKGTEDQAPRRRDHQLQWLKDRESETDTTSDTTPETQEDDLVG